MLQAELGGGTLRHGGSGRLFQWMALCLIKTGIKLGVAEVLVLAFPAPTELEGQLCGSRFFAPCSLPLPEFIVGTRLQQI